MRIATFNIENLDEPPPDAEFGPTLEERIAVLRPQLERIDADVLCLQEVHGQERPGQRRALLALEALVANTRYASYTTVTTLTSEKQPYDKRNLVVLTRLPVLEVNQYRNDRVGELLYRDVTAIPPETEAGAVRWQRPILHVALEWEGMPMHVINLHLKSKNPTPVAGQRLERNVWRSVAGWAEGYFLSSMKRVGQALETRLLVDELFDADPDARIAVCGDFNAEPGEVPVEAITGRVENTDNPALVPRQLFSCSHSIPGESRYTHLHEGQGNLLDHMVISRALVARYRHAEIHNEMLHDESIRGAFDDRYPESDHAPFVVEFRDPSAARRHRSPDREASGQAT